MMKYHPASVVATECKATECECKLQQNNLPQKRNLFSRFDVWKLERALNSINKKNYKLYEKMSKIVARSTALNEDTKNCLSLLKLEFNSNCVVKNRCILKLIELGVEENFDIKNYQNSLLFYNPYKHLVMSDVFKPLIDETIIKVCNIEFVKVKVHPNVDGGWWKYRGFIADKIQLKQLNPEERTKLLKGALIKEIKSVFLCNVTPDYYKHFNLTFLSLEDLSLSHLVFLCWCFVDDSSQKPIRYQYYDNTINEVDWTLTAPYVEEINDTLMLNFSGYHIHDKPHYATLRSMSSANRIVYFQK